MKNRRINKAMLVTVFGLVLLFGAASIPTQAHALAGKGFQLAIGCKVFPFRNAQGDLCSTVYPDWANGAGVTYCVPFNQDDPQSSVKQLADLIAGVCLGLTSL